MNAADEKRQLHQVMRARQRLNASLRAQVSGRPLALRNGDSFLYWRTGVVLLCAAKDETSVDIVGRMFCCNFLRKSRL
jgi:hypothetical protein